MLIISNNTVALVAEESAVLLDWTKVDSFDDLKLVVEAAGTGEGAVDTLSLSTSDDGGLTYTAPVVIEDFAALPLAVDTAGTYSFSTAKKYIKITAESTVGSITANAFLLGDPLERGLCTLADVKSRLGMTTADNDVLLERIIAGVEAIFNKHVMYPLIAPAADVTEYYTGCGCYLQLNSRPIISITSIKEAVDYDFAAATALVANVDYRIVKGGKNGILYRIAMDWLNVPDCTEIKWRGGYCAAGITPATGEFALPDDLREAAILQTTLVFKRKDDIGLSSVGAQGGSASKFTDIELLPMVKEILKDYIRKVA